LYNYSGYSLESLLEFKNLVNWPGIPIKDFYRIITYNNTANPSDAFTETSQTNLSVLENNATNPVKYIKVAPSRNDVDPLDILIYETRKNLEDEITSRASLISYESTSDYPYDDDGFKPGYYYLETTDGIVDYIYIAVPENITDFDGLNLSDRSFSYHLYDNPNSRLYAFGINRNTGDSQNNWYFDVITQEGAAGDTTLYEGFTYTFQEDDYKNGLTLEQILIGEQFPSSTTPISSGILFGTGFKLGEIHPQIQLMYRSNLEFNNLTRYQAIKQVAETFDSIAVFNTVDNTVSFYPEIIEDGETDPWNNNGLVLRYGAYLKSLQKDIDSSKIITMAQGIGKDNIPISLVTPTGDNFWEDYSYFLDEYYISNTTGFTITYDATKGLDITYPAGSRSSRWMPAAEAQKISEWQYTRDYFHNLLLGEPISENIAHDKYENLYAERLEALNAFVKLQTEVEQKLALKFKYFTLKEHYIKQNKNNPGTYNDKENEYTRKYNEVSFQVGSARRRLKRIENLVYDKEQDGSKNYVFYANAVTTNGSAVINLIQPNFDLVVGAAVSGDGIPLGATIASIENGLKFTLSANATATVNVNNAVRLTFTESLPESYAHKLLEIKTILNKSNWSIDLNALKSFQREAVVTDSKIDNEFELLLSVVKHVEENKKPIVTIQTGVADILAAEEAYQDWDKVKVGEKIYLFLPNLNVDQESLVREVSIDFEGNSLSFVISTVRNYNKNILSSAFKLVRELKNSERNFNNYVYDRVNYASSEEIPALEDVIETGDSPNQTGPEDQNGDAPENNQEGGQTPEIEDSTIDPPTETFQYKYTTGVFINNGKLTSFKQYTPDGEDPYTIEAEISAANGFEIRRIDGSAENDDLVVTKQAYINNDGEGVIGPVFIAAKDTSAVTLNESSGLILNDNNLTGSTTQLDANNEYVEYKFNQDGTKVLGIKTVSFNVEHSGLGAASVNVALYRQGTLIATFTGQTAFDEFISDSTGSAESVYNADRVRLTLSIVGAGTAEVLRNSINVNTLNKSITLNNFNVTTTGELYAPKIGIGNFGLTNTNRDSIVIEPHPTGTNYRHLKLMTPSTALTNNRTIRFPDKDGIIALTSDLNDTNTYVSSASFNTSTGVLTLTRNDAATVTVDLDGRYVENTDNRLSNDRIATFWEGASTTATTTTGKLVTISGFIRTIGALIRVRFSNGSKVNNPTLNINNGSSNTGIANIRIEGDNATIDNFSLSQNTEVTFRWDGTYYQVISINNSDHAKLIQTGFTITNSLTNPGTYYNVFGARFILLQGYHTSVSPNVSVYNLWIDMTDTNQISTTARSHRIVWNDGTSTFADTIQAQLSGTSVRFASTSGGTWVYRLTAF